jgi:Ni,Fe-hydrogenase III small subunit
MLNILKNRLFKGVVTGQIDVKALTRAGFINPEAEAVGLELKEMIRKKFGRSLHIREVDTGSCGACESEIIALNNPVYDLQRFGINFVASPRHADCLLVTGPVSKNMALALKKTYDAMPEPKFVITLGNCALDGGIFKEAYYIEGGVANIIPVTFHISGCPPKPLDIMKALLAFLKLK